MYSTTIYHELTTTTIVSQGIRRTIRASESPQSGYIMGSSGPARTDRCGRKVLLISRFQVRVLGGSLPNSLQNSRKVKSPGPAPGLLCISLCINAAGGTDRASSEGLVYRPTRAAVHAGDYVRIGVQRLGYGGVPEELLDVFGVDVAGEEQGGAGVAEVVELEVIRQPGAFCGVLELTV